MTLEELRGLSKSKLLEIVAIKSKDELIEIILKEFDDLENLFVEVNRPEPRVNNKKNKISRISKKEFLEMLKDDLW